MPSFAYPERLGRDHEAGEDLEEAREALAYWEDRARRLPRRAVRKRREAREMVVRAHARVAEAERAAYGRGLVGALTQIVVERRLPAHAERRGRVAARRAAQAATVVVATVAVLSVAVVVAVVALLVAVL